MILLKPQTQHLGLVPSAGKHQLDQDIVRTRGKRPFPEDRGGLTRLQVS
jgi:hypothetical protein